MLETHDTHLLYKVINAGLNKKTGIYISNLIKDVMQTTIGNHIVAITTDGASNCVLAHMCCACWKSHFRTLIQLC